MLISLLPWAQPVGAESSKATDTPAVAVDEMDLEAVGERIRQTGVQMQADLRKARARLEAHKAQQAAERRREAELARQQAIKDEAERERKQREAAQKKAEPARQAALAAQRAKEEKAAKERAAKALKEALQSDDKKAFSDEDL
jgi:hypothetical protein